MAEFTQDWFTQNIPIWEISLAEFKDKPVKAIEIGSFEGRATLWLLDNILTHPAATIDCVDTWEGSPNEHNEIDFKAVQERFEQNIKPHEAKVDVYQTTSVDYLRHQYNPADIIYIDGSHVASDVLTDAVLAHQILKPGGMIIFDDYLWTGLAHTPHSPRAAIDAFIECFALDYEMVASSYQVILRKKKDGQSKNPTIGQVIQ